LTRLAQGKEVVFPGKRGSTLGEAEAKRGRAARHKFNIMITDKLDTKDFFVSFLTTSSDFLHAASAFSVEEINAHPASGGWTAGQVVEHVTRSISSITRAMKVSGNKVQREPDERVDEFKKLFLNFSVKFTSPKFVLPSLERHDKKTSVDELNSSFVALAEATKIANLAEGVKDPALGEVTKFELLYLALYHTQRHARQLVNIYGDLQPKKAGEIAK
jgi:hypothetical protein